MPTVILTKGEGLGEKRMEELKVLPKWMLCKGEGREWTGLENISPKTRVWMEGGRGGEDDWSAYCQ